MAHSTCTGNNGASAGALLQILESHSCKFGKPPLQNWIATAEGLEGQHCHFN